MHIKDWGQATWQWVNGLWSGCCCAASPPLRGNVAESGWCAPINGAYGLPLHKGGCLLHFNKILTQEALQSFYIQKGDWIGMGNPGVPLWIALGNYGPPSHFCMGHCSCLTLESITDISTHICNLWMNMQNPGSSFHQHPFAGKACAIWLLV